MVNRKNFKKTNVQHHLNSITLLLEQIRNSDPIRTHLENSFESVEKPFAGKYISSITHLISTAKNTQNSFEPPIKNKINQFYHFYICINLKKSAQDIRNKKSTILLTPLNLNLGLHSNLTENSNKSNVN